jgi:hypothetical protein
MGEPLLPGSVLSKASLRGNEYAWPLWAVEEAVRAAEACGLANLGGQAQFRFPEGIYELYWLSLDSGERRPNMTWEEYVTRSAEEVLTQFTALRERTDFIQEGFRCDVLRQLHVQGVDLNPHLCFVLYFGPKPSRWREWVPKGFSSLFSKLRR